MIYRLVQLSLLLFAVLGALAAPVTTRTEKNNVEMRDSYLSERQDSSEMACNGHPELCDRKYGNVTFLGAHDSFAFSPNPLALSRTQEANLTAQLDFGARLLQAQARMNNGELHFCHTSCPLFDGGSVESYLLTVRSWLSAHPNEVLTLIFTNPEEHSVPKVWKPIFEKTEFDKLAYIPPQPVMGRDDWPTLREMIDSGRRVIVFLDKGADNRKEPEKEYILPQFKMMWEDPHNPTANSFPCPVDRTQGPLPPSEQLNLMNHNLNVNLLPIVIPGLMPQGLKIPDRLNTPRTNSIYSVYQHAMNCAGTQGNRNPNFVLTDFTTVGFAKSAVDYLNGFSV